MTRQSLMVLLVGINLFLLAVLLVGSYSLPAAGAQTTGAAGGFVAVTAAADGEEYEVLYVLDLAVRKLHAFAPTNVQTKRLKYLDTRDLEADLRRQP